MADELSGLYSEINRQHAQELTLSPALLAWREIKHYGCPDAPGCYAIYLDGELSYIGQSISVSSRLSSYQIHISLFGDKEWATVWGNFDSVVIKYKPSKRYGDWLMREARLIRRLCPRLNYRGVGQRSQRARLVVA